MPASEVIATLDLIVSITNEKKLEIIIVIMPSEQSKICAILVVLNYFSKLCHYIRVVSIILHDNTQSLSGDISDFCDLCNV